MVVINWKLGSNRRRLRFCVTAGFVILAIWLMITYLSSGTSLAIPYGPHWPGPGVAVTESKDQRGKDGGGGKGGTRGGAAVKGRRTKEEIRKAKEWNDRADVVKEAYKYAFRGYEKYAWGMDELLPVSKKGGNSQSGWGATIVDGLSTAIMMRLSNIVDKQLEYISTVNFGKSKERISMFETTIRYLAGLVSAYDLLKGPYANLVTEKNTLHIDKLLSQAIILADGMLPAFDTTTGIPFGYFWLPIVEKVTDQTNSLAGIGSLVLEFTRLSDITKDPKYAQAAQKAQDYLLKPRNPELGEPFPGLVGSWVDLHTGNFTDGSGGWWAFCDSFYEYLLKMYIYDPTRFTLYKERYIAAANSTMTHLAQHPATRPDLTFLGEFHQKHVASTSGHLVCFAGGNFLLAGEVLGRGDYTAFGVNLTKSCRETYLAHESGLGPERWSWEVGSAVVADGMGGDGYGDGESHEGRGQSKPVVSNGPHGIVGKEWDYRLRPEVIESYYYAWRMTGEEVYRTWAWEAWLAIERSCKTSMTDGENNGAGGGKEEQGDIGGFSSVKYFKREKGDMQESYFFAETLKYLWLTFRDDEGDGVSEEESVVGVVKGRQKWVFNTEAHPFRVVG